MKKLLIAFLLTCLFLGSFVSGAPITFYRREALVGVQSVEISDTILFKTSPAELKIPVFFSVEDFTVQSTFSQVNCGVEEQSYGTLIRCDLPDQKQGRLTLKFLTEELVREVNSHYFFKNTLSVPLQTEKLTYTAELGSGLILIENNKTSPFPVYSPESGEKGSDGRRIFVYWNRKNLESGESVSPSLSFEQMKKPEKNFNNLYTLITGGVILISLLILSLKLGPEDRKLALKPDESKIVDIIKNAGGGVKQKRIVNRTDFSKAKVSRLIKDLVERDLLEKEKVGRTNRIYLKEKK